MATALTCAAALALSPVAPAHADTTAGPKYHDYTLQITSAVEQRGDTAMSWARWATLDCDPVGGHHPRAQEACDLIAEHGDIASVEVAADGVCTMIYRPVTVRVSGIEEYEETFSNECVMHNAKGAVFDF